MEKNSEACQCWRIVTPELELTATKKSRRLGSLNQFQLTKLYCPNCNIYFDSIDQYHGHVAEVKHFGLLPCHQEKFRLLKQKPQKKNCSMMPINQRGAHQFMKARGLLSNAKYDVINATYI